MKYYGESHIRSFYGPESFDLSTRDTAKVERVVPRNGRVGMNTSQFNYIRGRSGIDHKICSLEKAMCRYIYCGRMGEFVGI